MQRTRRAMGIALLLALGCGPNDRPRDLCRREPTFVVRVTAEDGALPDDTRLLFLYGSVQELFTLDRAETPRVVFCDVATSAPDVSGEGGAAGAPSPAVSQITCELWTAGSTTVEVTATGYAPIKDFSLQTEEDSCTVTKGLELEREIEEP